MPVSNRIKLFIIHGWGGSYLEAAARVTDLLAVESWWHQGRILVPRRRAGLLRHLLNEPSGDPVTGSLRKLVVSRFLRSPSAPRAVRSDTAEYSLFSEDRIRRDYPKFGIPSAPGDRWQRARQLQEEAEKELAPVLAVLRALLDEMARTTAPRTEALVRERLTALSARAGAGDLVPLLEHLREMHETGGDLDTVASAVMYARHFEGEARRAGQPFRYGHEYRFVFLNYHESMMALADHAPADVYAADLPTGAFPAMEHDIRELARHNVRTIRFEDHHPWAADRKTSLQQLVTEGLLGTLALSGPPQGAEQPEDEQRSAAEMIYESLIEGGPDDNEATRSLRVATHGEDFMRDRTPLGILLTDLIKGGINKVELGQLLLAALDNGDFLPRLQARGWAGLPDAWKDDIAATAETLRENTCLLKLADGKTTIVSALATHADPGKPKLTTGKAIEFFAQNFPDVQYVFYSWGSSIMVARRLDHADTTLNLGSLMPALGGPGDGGHAGAAVCRPDTNARYPKRLLGRVSASNFKRYNQYLATRLTEQGHAVTDVRDVSVPSSSTWNRGNRRLIIILAGALALGLALIYFVPAYHPDRIRESNADFMPHLESADPDADRAPLVDDLERML